MEGFPFVIEQQVVFRDIDMLGHVNNAVYATYFETARVEYLYQLARDLPERCDFVLAELTITYRSPAFIRERLLIGQRVSEIRNSSMIIDGQIIEKTSGRLVATSRAVLVHVDRDANRPIPIPDKLRALIARFEGKDL